MHSYTHACILVHVIFYTHIYMHTHTHVLTHTLTQSSPLKFIYILQSIPSPISFRTEGPLHIKALLGLNYSYDSLHLVLLGSFLIKISVLLSLPKSTFLG